MRTIEQEVLANRKKLDELVADFALKNDSVPSTAPMSLELPQTDEDQRAALIQARTARREKFVQERDKIDATAEQYREQVVKAEANLRKLYQEKPKTEKVLAEEREKLLQVRPSGSVRPSGPIGMIVGMYEERVRSFKQDLDAIIDEITDLEEKYPELRVKLQDEKSDMEVHRRFLQRFAHEIHDGKVCYTAKGTPNPSPGHTEDSRIFLEKSIKEANDSNLIVRVTQGGWLFTGFDGTHWNPYYPQSSEGTEVCQALGQYRQAYMAVRQVDVERWATEDIAAGVLLTPQEAEKRKKDPRNHHNILAVVEARDGFCFIALRLSEEDRDRPTEHELYWNVRQEILIEYHATADGEKKHELQITAITAPQFVVDFFLPKKDGPYVRQVFAFDDINEIAKGVRISPSLRGSLYFAIRRAVSRANESAVMASIEDVSCVSDLRTLDQLACGAVGRARIHIPERYGKSAIGFELVSDGITVRPGALATEYSKKILVYEHVLDGKPVTQFFARAKDGSFANSLLEEIAVRNAPFELTWLTPAALKEHNETVEK